MSVSNAMPENDTMSADRRILILGAGGFVGRYLRAALSARFRQRAQIVATSLAGTADGEILPLDLLSPEALRASLGQLQPTHVINLAGLASPVAARRNVDLAWRLHAIAPEILGGLIAELVPECWLFHVGSGLVYGRSALSGELMTEYSLLAPTDPYSVTKAAGDLAVGALVGQGLKCLRLRPFNHTGPGQSEDFVVTAFAGQLARIAKGLQPPVLQVGNLDAERDFLDVRDVADAYATLIECSDSLKPGAIYNIASGEAISIRRILEKLISSSGLTVRVDPDPDRQRPSDLPRIAGSARKLQDDTGWTPRFRLDETLSAIYSNMA